MKIVNKEYFESFDGLKIPYTSFESGNKKKILMLHGLYEYIDRYNEFAVKLNEAGYDVYILEYRGHGDLREGNVADFGDKGITGVLNDIKLFIKHKFSNIANDDIFLIGKGLGGLLTLYLQENMQLKNSVLISVPIEKKFSIFLGRVITKMEMKFGLKNSFINKFMLKTLNRSFVKEGKSAWLNRDKEIVKAYLNDENYLKSASSRLYNNVLSFTAFVKKNIKKISENANIFIVFGTKDALVSETKLKKYMQKINNGKNNIKFLKVKKARHDILFELNKDTIIEEIIKYMDGINNEN
ncbi:serine aminopeptidase domain-containing protein [Streptobacillus moniliformis]|uniref:serine aminopeptidase domain-containing protein n=1 Tax=Streptobacillus moniliformis TaxID=34105 RepID=UPI0007E4B116|nr:alpha/beta hydrolase [Streptobacillus moniliformis]